MKISDILDDIPQNTISALTQEEVSFLLNGLKSKGIGNKTCMVALDFLACNKIAFGKFLDTKEVATRLISHLDQDIKFMTFFDPNKTYFSGQYEAKTKCVLVSKYCVKNSEKSGIRAKKRSLRSLFLHEFDHCSCMNEKDLPSEEIMQAYFDKYPETKPKKLKSLLHFSKKYGCGISVPKSYIESGINAQKSLDMLDEGITVYKQKKYDKIWGFKTEVDGEYEFFYQVADHIAKIIGEEKMVWCHFYGEYNEMRKAYMRRTGVDLNHLATALSTYDILVGYSERKEVKTLVKNLIKKIEEVSLNSTTLRASVDDMINKTQVVGSDTRHNSQVAMCESNAKNNSQTGIIGGKNTLYAGLCDKRNKPQVGNAIKHQGCATYTKNNLSSGIDDKSKLMQSVNQDIEMEK